MILLAVMTRVIHKAAQATAKNHFFLWEAKFVIFVLVYVPSSHYYFTHKAPRFRTHYSRRKGKLKGKGNTKGYHYFAQFGVSFEFF